MSQQQHSPNTASSNRAPAGVAAASAVVFTLDQRLPTPLNIRAISASSNSSFDENQPVGRNAARSIIGLGSNSPSPIPTSPHPILTHTPSFEVSTNLGATSPLHSMRHASARTVHMPSQGFLADSSSDQHQQQLRHVRRASNVQQVVAAQIVNAAAAAGEQGALVHYIPASTLQRADSTGASAEPSSQGVVSIMPLMNTPTRRASMEQPLPSAIEMFHIPSNASSSNVVVVDQANLEQQAVDAILDAASVTAVVPANNSDNFNTSVIPNPSTSSSSSDRPPPFLKTRSLPAEKHSRSTRHLTLEAVIKSPSVANGAIPLYPNANGQPFRTIQVRERGLDENGIITEETEAEVKNAHSVQSVNRFDTQQSRSSSQHDIHTTSPSPTSPPSSACFRSGLTRFYYLLLYLHQLTSGTMPAAYALMTQHPLTAFLDAYLRGWGQVVFQNNPITGIAIIIAMLINNVWIGLMGIWATFCATLFAKLMNLNPGAYSAGLYGYNSVLVGLGIGTFDAAGVNGEWNWAILIPIAILSVFSVFLLLALSNILVAKLNVAPLTLPFNLSCILYLTGAVLMGYYPIPFHSGSSPSALPTIRQNTADIDWHAWIKSVPIGVGQVFLAGELSSGILVLLGIAVCSPVSATFAMICSAVGGLTALGLGIDKELVYGSPASSASGYPSGLWGYNSVLGGIALGGFFYLPNVTSSMMAIFCAIMCAFVQATIRVLFTSLGGFPTLTFPFCLVTLVFLLLHGNSFPNRLIPIPLPQLTYPEEHWKRWRVHGKMKECMKDVNEVVQMKERVEKERMMKELNLMMLNGENQPNTSSTTKPDSSAPHSSLPPPPRSSLVRASSLHRQSSVHYKTRYDDMTKEEMLRREKEEKLRNDVARIANRSQAEIRERSEEIQDLLDAFYDLLDTNGASEILSLEQIRVSFNNVLGAETTNGVSMTARDVAKLLTFFTDEEVEEEERKNAAASASASASSPPSASTPIRQHRRYSATASSAPSLPSQSTTSDYALFLNLDPDDVYIEYDQFFQYLVHYTRIEWKVSELGTRHRKK